MTLARAEWAPSTLPAEVRAELAQSLEPVRKDAFLIHRRNAREAMLSVSSPGYGKFSALAVRLITECARLRNVDTPFPRAFRIYRGKVAGYFLLEPLMQYDETDPEQYPIRWYEGFRVAKIDLLPVLQPHNLDVPRGYVMEVAVTLETLPEAGPFLVLHVGDAAIRPMGSRKERRFAAEESRQERREDRAALEPEPQSEGGPPEPDLLRAEPRPAGDGALPGATARGQEAGARPGAGDGGSRDHFVV